MTKNKLIIVLFLYCTCIVQAADNNSGSEAERSPREHSVHGTSSSSSGPASPRDSSSSSGFSGGVNAWTAWGLERSNSQASSVSINISEWDAPSSSAASAVNELAVPELELAVPELPRQDDCPRNSVVAAVWAQWKRIALPTQAQKAILADYRNHMDMVGKEDFEILTHWITPPRRGAMSGAPMNERVRQIIRLQATVRLLGDQLTKNIAFKNMSLRRKNIVQERLASEPFLLTDGLSELISSFDSMDKSTRTRKTFNLIARKIGANGNSSRFSMRQAAAPVDVQQTPEDIDQSIIDIRQALELNRDLLAQKRIKLETHQRLQNDAQRNHGLN